MRKEGFTLAEVLITIAIIGVVAALSIPQFAADIYNKSNASQLSTIVTNYEDVFGMMLLREDRENIFETNFGTALSTANNEQNFNDRLSAYTNISRTGTNLTENLGYSGGIANINGEAPEFPQFRYGAVTPGGALLMFAAPTQSTSIVHIDVNGPTQPNRYGRDVFTFVLAQDGHLYPYGSRQAAIVLGQGASQTWDNSSTDAPYRCTGSGYTGQGCTARLIENNYNVDY